MPGGGATPGIRAAHRRRLGMIVEGSGIEERARGSRAGNGRSAFGTLMPLASDRPRTAASQMIQADGGIIASRGFLDRPEGSRFIPDPTGGTVAKLTR
jgi:hypothetical protein